MLSDLLSRLVMQNALVRFVAGDDVFISYPRHDGTTYATGLATELAKRRIACRFDQWGTEPGRQVPRSLINAVARSAVLVVIGSAAAAQSPNVAEEIRVFKKTGRRIVLVQFDGMRISDALWSSDVMGLPPSIEPRAALDTGNPSETVVSRIEKTLTFWKRDTRLRTSALVAGFILVGLLAASAWAARSAARSFAVLVGQQAATEAGSRQSEALRSKKGWSTIIEHSVLLAVEAAQRLSSHGVPIADSISTLRAGLDLLPRSVRHVTHEHGIQIATLARGGRYVITQEDDDTIRVWDTVTDRQLSGDIKANSKPAFDGDRTLMAIERPDRSLAILALPSGTVLWATASGHEHTEVHFSDDGAALAAGEPSKIAVWNARTGQPMATVPYRGELKGLAISSAHDLLALSLGSASDEDTTLQIVRLTGAKPATIVETQIKPQSTEIGCDQSPSYLALTDLSFSADARLLAASSGFHATVRDVGTLREVTAIGGPDRDPNQVQGCNNVKSIDILSFAEDGRTLATVGSDGTLQTWDALSGRLLWTGEDTGSPPPTACAIEVEDTGLRVIDITNARDVARIVAHVKTLEYDPFKLVTRSCDYARAENHVVVSNSHDLWLFDISNAQQDGHFELDRKLGAFAGTSIDSRYSALVDGPQVSIWDVKSDQLVSTVTLDGDAYEHIAFSPDGSVFAAASATGMLRVYKTATGAELWSKSSLPFRSPEKDDEDAYWTINRMRFSPQGTVLSLETGDVEGEANSIAWLFNAADGNLIARVSAASDVSSNVRFSDDDTLAVVEREGGLDVIETAAGHMVQTVPLETGGSYTFAPRTKLIAKHDVRSIIVMDAVNGHSRSTTAFGGSNPVLAFSKSGKLLAIFPQGTPTAAEVIEAANGRVVASIPASKIVWQSEFSPSERYLVTGGDRTGADEKTGTSEIIIFDLMERSSTVQTIEGEVIDQIVFDQGEKYVAVTSFESSTAHVFEVPSGRRAAELINEAKVVGLGFSDDGSLLAYATGDVAHVWRTSDWSEVARIREDREVKSVRFADGTRLLVTRAEDGTIRRWVLSEHELRERACERVSRNLTPSEWRGTFGAEPYARTCINISEPATQSPSPSTKP